MHCSSENIIIIEKISVEDLNVLDFRKGSMQAALITECLENNTISS